MRREYFFDIERIIHLYILACFLFVTAMVIQNTNKIISLQKEIGKTQIITTDMWQSDSTANWNTKW